MSLTLFPCDIKDRKDKFMFCFNPYPLQPIKDSVAIEGYLTSDYAKQLVEGWGVRILKKCFRDTERTIIENGKWPFYGLNTREHCKGNSLYDDLKEKGFIK